MSVRKSDCRLRRKIAGFVLLQTSDTRETLERACLGCRSDNPKERAVSLEVLMRAPGRTFNEEAVKVVEALSKTETNRLFLKH